MNFEREKKTLYESRSENQVKPKLSHPIHPIHWTWWKPYSSLFWFTNVLQEVLLLQCHKVRKQILSYMNIGIQNFNGRLTLKSLVSLYVLLIEWDSKKVEMHETGLIKKVKNLGFLSFWIEEESLQSCREWNFGIRFRYLSSLSHLVYTCTNPLPEQVCSIIHSLLPMNPITHSNATQYCYFPYYTWKRKHLSLTHKIRCKKFTFKAFHFPSWVS